MDGTIVGWGYNEFSQASPPPGNDYVAIAAQADICTLRDMHITIDDYSAIRLGLPDGHRHIKIKAR